MSGNDSSLKQKETAIELPLFRKRMDESKKAS